MSLTATTITYLFDVSIDVSESFQNIAMFVDRINKNLEFSFGRSEKLALMANVYTLSVTADKELTAEELEALGQIIKICVGVAVSGRAMNIKVRRDGGDV